MVPPKTSELLRDLREELRALDLAIATFERLAALRGEDGDTRAPGSGNGRPPGKKRPSRGSPVRTAR